MAEAIDFLTDLIKDGPMSSDEVHELAKRAGRAERTLNRAKKELNIASKRSDGKWLRFWPTALVQTMCEADFKRPLMRTLPRLPTVCPAHGKVGNLGNLAKSRSSLPTPLGNLQTIVIHI